ncbi:MAG: DUF4390 domain-containing protein [Xanthomonadales bacterium]|nr:DUF4390 domain-containing protein [Xanthomonadales bacterium]
MKTCKTKLLLMLAATLLLGACNHGEHSDPFFKVKSVEADVNTQPIKVYAELELKFSPAVEEALNKGVSIPLKAIARVTADNRLGWTIVDHGQRWEIHYLPLSRHYQLKDLHSKKTTTWPRLRHALGALRRITIELPPTELAPGNYRIEFKIFLDRRKLPAPMRLPSLVSSGWQLETNWYQWPFQITK